MSGQPVSAATASGAYDDANQDATADVIGRGAGVGLGGQPPPLGQREPARRQASVTAAYMDGSVTTATWAWFLAAALVIAGPPMSICSTHSSGAAPAATACSNGYRLETSSSNGASPSSAS